MKKSLFMKKGLMVGIMLMVLGSVVSVVCDQPVSAIAPDRPQITQKHLDLRTLFANGEWIEQATGFSERNRGINSVSCVNENIVWASAFNGDNPGYPCQDFTITVDGGATWNANTVLDAENLYFSMIHAYDENTAWAPLYAHQNGVMGLYYTTDGGTTWIRQESADFNLIGSFPNCVYFWDATVGWCMGDPAGGYYEIYTTTDAGTAWTRVPEANIPAPLTGEYSLVGSYCVAGDSVWFGTSMGRVYRSTDKGLHWTVAQTTLTSYTKPVFRDAAHGLAADINTAGSPHLSETSDGGVTWKKVAFTGPCYNYDICYVPGTVNMYISTGASSNASGASYSLDGGHTWIDYADMSGTPMLGLGFTSGRIGWAGSYNTDVFTGGIFKHVPTGETHPAFSIDVTGGKGFTVNVTNVGDAAATDVQCTVTITGGFIVRPKQFSGSLPSLAIGENLTIHGTPKGIGLGLLFPLPSIQVDVSCTEDVAAAKTVQAQIFFSKVTLQ